MSAPQDGPEVGGAGFAATDPRARRFFVALAYGVLGLSTVVVLVFDEAAAARPAHVLGLVAAAAAWTPLLGLVAGRPLPSLVYFAGLLAVSAALGAVSTLFALFASIGYPLAFALFSSRWSVIAVMVTAIVNVVAQNDGGGAAMHAPLLALALPLVLAGWLVGAESERRKDLVAELSAANARLEDALAENAALQARLVEQAREAGVLDERQRLAREIHDTIAQGLIAVITQVRAAVASPPGSGRARRHLEIVESLARQALGEARRSVQALRPAALERSRLPDALSDMAERWSAASGVPIAVEVTGDARALATNVEVALFRVAQEALANVAKHAGAARAGLTLSYLDDVVLLDVRDDGVGFDPGHAPAEGFGLVSMRERVREVGGTLEIESGSGQGTAVAVCVPAAGDGRTGGGGEAE
ncbi:sensor histidine kinase [Thermopolyspora sp. NPDC052614]|uniref:sensor histidine kinase n=1 Tax=Thermopolyspora sp. NPDC052614 TaxID=3155682 RepID=UPI003424EB98